KAEEGPAATPELLEACAKHLGLLHRRRLVRDLGPEMAKLAGEVPKQADVDASRGRLRALGLKGDDEAFASASAFAKLAQPTVARGGSSFLGWTPDYED